MHSMRTKLAAVALALGAPATAPAADAADLAALREEIAQMRKSYEGRIAALEQRLAQAENTAGRAENAALQAEGAARAASQRPAGESAMNPGISLILSGMYTNLKVDPAGQPWGIAGFVPSMGEVAPPARSFSLGESELVVAANIDHRVRGVMTLALPPEAGEAPQVEEGYIQTLGLWHGLTLKAGRFLSGLGYMNEQHAHAWDFSDAPLAYKAFFGNQLRGDGIQLKWVAPTETFLEFGAEAGRGGAFPSADRNKNGFQTGTLFAHVGGDVGRSHSWRAGLSYMRSSPRDRAYTDDGNGTTNAFTGRSRTWIADAVWKWAPEGNASYRSLTLQGEYFQRREDGTLAYDIDGTALNCLLADCRGGYRTSQSGWYAQAVWKFRPTWRVGFRHDRLNAGSMDNGLAIDPATGLSAADFPVLAGHRPRRNTVMLDWSPSEFSRVRLQFARDQSRASGADNQVWLHYIVSLGSHGAHKF
ncbi:MAG: carbohydrate porin [Rhodocyclaceae bacterium]|nr:carbohydrate porin [Rhodocyclaceae bacterium]